MSVFKLSSLSSPFIGAIFIIYRYSLTNKMMDIQTGNKKNAENSIPWVEKYRPQTLKDLISHEAILNTLRKFINEDNLPNLLFYGPPGTGKTSTIKALAKQFYQQNYNKMVLELNASDERGIDVVRNEIKSFACNKTLISNNNSLKLIILDEADMMTQASQFALRRIIEKYANNARFCLISNYVSRVIPALQSRCTRFKFKQIPYEAAIQRIKQICQAQNLALNEGAMEAVFGLCQGDMRRIVNMLQSISLIGSTNISQDDIYSFTGNPAPASIQRYMQILRNEDVSNAFDKLQSQFQDYGISMQSIVKQIYGKLLNQSMNKSAKVYLIDRLGDIEYRLSIGGQQNLALGSLVGAFYQARNFVEEE